MSELDITELEKTYDIPVAKLTLLPNTVDVDFFAQTHSLYNKFSERKKLGFSASSLLLLFHGRMDYSANADALRFILQELAPVLKQSSHSDTRLIVAGPESPNGA